MSSTWSYLSDALNAAVRPLLVNAGMTPLQAIEAATANGPVTLGPRGPRSGQLTAGYDADLLGLTVNPLEDIAALTDRAAISWIWKDGQPVKSNGADQAPRGTPATSALLQLIPTIRGAARRQGTADVATRSSRSVGRPPPGSPGRSRQQG